MPQKSDWVIHMIYTGFESHEGIIGDIDGDGYRDIISREDEASPNHNHVLRNMLIENK